MSDSILLATRATKDESLEDMLRTHRQIGRDAWSKRWEKATRMQRFVNNEQWGDADANKLDKGPSKSPRLSINEIGPVLAAFAGRQMMQRFERAYMPRHIAATRDAEVMTAVDRAMMHATDAEQVESAAFKDGPGIQGTSCVRWELDDLNERGGGIMLTDAPIWQMMADPESRAVNLSDRAWHRFGSWWAQTTVRDRWPDKWEKIVGSLGGNQWSPKDMTTSSRIPWVGMGGNKPLEPYYPRGRSFWVEYEEWKTVEPFWEVGVPTDQTQTYAQALAASTEVAEGVPDPMTTTRVESSAELSDLKQQYEAAGNPIPKEYIVSHRQVVYHYAYIIGDTVVETGEVPTGYWTFQFYTGTRYPLANVVEWMSLVERLIDPQKWVNVFWSAQIRNIQITPKGSLFVEEGFFRNRNEAMAAWSAPGGLVMVGRGKLTSGQHPGYKIEAGGTQPYASMLAELMSFAREAIPRMAGFNAGALGQLGSDLRRISGEVVRQVQDAAMVSNAEMFDSLRHARREGGRIFLSFIRAFLEVEDIIRIIGEENAYEDVIDPMTGQQATGPDGQPMRNLVVPDKSKWNAEYWREISIEDVVPTADQKKSLWDALQTSLPVLMQPQADTGMPLFSSEDYVELMPGISSQRQAKMLQRIKAQVQARQQQMMQQPPADPNAAVPPN